MRSSRKSQTVFSADRLSKAVAKPPSTDGPSGDPIRDTITETLQQLDRTLLALDTLRQSIRTLAADVTEALSEEAVGRRALIAENFDSQRLSLTQDITRYSPLLSPDSETISLSLYGGSSYNISPVPLMLGYDPLNIPPADGGFVSRDEVTTILSHVDGSLRKLDTAMDRIARDRRFLMSRVAP